MNEPRKIFADADSIAQSSSPPRKQSPSADGGRISTGMQAWLISLLVLVVAMVAIGGLTRLTDSGLSITEWRLIAGTIPPLNEVDWQIAFEKYQNTSEFKIQNSNMSLPEFKTIYWWEWTHRVIGRITGLVWAVGFVWLLATKNLTRSLDLARFSAWGTWRFSRSYRLVDGY